MKSKGRQGKYNVHVHLTLKHDSLQYQRRHQSTYQLNTLGNYCPHMPQPVSALQRYRPGSCVL